MSSNENGNRVPSTALSLRGATVPRARGAKVRASQWREVFEQLARGQMLHTVCADLGIDRVTVWRRSMQDPDGFGREYHLARELGTHAIAEDAQRVADGSDAVTGLYHAAIEWAADQAPSPDVAASLVNVLRNAEIQQRKLRIEVLKWRAAKLAPRLYGRLAELSAEDGKGGDAGPVKLIVLRYEDRVGILKASGTEGGEFAYQRTEMSETTLLDALEQYLREHGRTAGELTQSRLPMEQRVEYTVRLFSEQPSGREKVLAWLGAPSVQLYMPDNGRARPQPAPAAVFAALTPDQQRAAIVHLCEQQGTDWLRQLLDVEEPNDG